jgi:hypothetical protein
VILSIRQSEGLSAPLAGALKEAASAAAIFLLVALAGCGGAEGVEAGATVRAYVVQPLCAGAEQQLQGAGGRAGEVHVQAICLPSAESDGQLELARAGANARRATEDSTAVAFIEAPGPDNEFSDPILESAEIPSIASSSGTRAMTQLLRAIDNAGSSSSLRASVSEELE